MLSDLQMDYASFNLWLEGESNQEDLERAKRALPVVLQEYVTPKQLEYILRYYVDQMSVLEIADLYGVCGSTVSRGIHRGMRKVYRYLRFTSPIFINAPERNGPLKNGKKRKKKWRT